LLLLEEVLADFEEDLIMTAKESVHSLCPRASLACTVE
jgi:hypothetical protein